MNNLSKLESDIFNIFDKTTAPEGAKRYLEFVRNQNYGYLPTIGNIGTAIVTMQLVETFPPTSTNSISNELYKACLLFKNSRHEINRIHLLFSYLGEMVCFWFLRDYKSVREVQQVVQNSKFDSTWWERNKKTVVGIGGAVIGAALMAFGGGSAGVGGVKGHQIVTEDISDIRFEEDRFNELRDAISSISFNINA